MRAKQTKHKKHHLFYFYCFFLMYLSQLGKCFFLKLNIISHHIKKIIKKQKYTCFTNTLC